MWADYNSHLPPDFCTNFAPGETMLKKIGKGAARVVLAVAVLAALAAVVVLGAQYTGGAQ